RPAAAPPPAGAGGPGPLPAAGSPAPPSINVRPPLASPVSGALLRSGSVRGVGRTAPRDPPAGAEGGSAGRGRVGVGTGTGTGPGGQGPSATRAGLRGRRRAAPSPRAPAPREDGPRAGEAGPPPGCKGGGGALRSRRHQAPCPLARLLRRPAEPWYKQAAGPRRYSVGRVPGLRSGLRRSPRARRSDTDGTAEPGPGVLLSGSALCVMDVAPKLRSCRALPGAPGALQCKADVTVSLDPGCLSADA
ncbi:neuropeptide B, partial [Mycteria americana]|uniref:neuropeptide B n=1 Tax=Mycteria americana TaxID=33587 RepID=UPI003F5837C0